MSADQPYRSQREDGQFVTKIVHPKHPRDYVTENVSHLLDDHRKERPDEDLHTMVHDWAFTTMKEIAADAASVEHQLDVYAVLTDEYDLEDFDWMGDTAVRENICYPPSGNDWRDSILAGIAFDLLLDCIRVELDRRGVDADV